jgi:hypothetical protein
MQELMGVNIPLKSIITISSTSMNLFLKKFNNLDNPILILRVQTPLSA